MKTKYFLLLAASAMLSFSSCSDYLEEKNQSGLTQDPYFSTETGVETSLNACYSGLRTWFGKEQGFNMSLTGTDIFLRGSASNEISDYAITLNSSNSIISDRWKYFYRALNCCNTTISLLPSKSLSDADNASYMGQAKFLRAMYLWLIVENFGNVILYTEPINAVTTASHRSSVDDFYKVIFDDLDYAISNLPAKKSSDGRITQDCAKAFAARMYLTRASETKNAEMYAKAAQYADEVIKSGRYSFYDKTSDLWDIANCDGGTNKEVVFYVNYTSNELQNGDFSEESNRGNQGLVDFVMKYDNQPGMVRDINNGRPFVRFMCSKHLLELFDENIDQRYDATFKNVWYSNAAKETAGSVTSYPLMVKGDTAIYTYKHQATDAMRAQAKGRYQLVDINDMFSPADDKPTTRLKFCEFHKFWDNTGVFNQQWSQRDAFVIRLSEMYLICAEALMNTNKELAADYINTLRMKRAKAGHEQDMKITSAQLNIDFILEERARELCGEQHRWFDLKRTGKLVEYVKKYNPDAKDNIQEYHNLRPIPLSELDAITNKDEFGQNPGYE